MRVCRRANRGGGRTAHAVGRKRNCAEKNRKHMESAPEKCDNFSKIMMDLKAEHEASINKTGFWFHIRGST